MTSRSVYQYHERRGGVSKEPAWEPFGPALEPTTAPPGSAERIREFRRRLELGREMWHVWASHLTDHAQGRPILLTAEMIDWGGRDWPYSQDDIHKFELKS